ncbi:MAG: branched-chain amino acid transport system substrate-binding protein [Moorella sp. (in: firmicutes)]|nr:branched-chain amino acid transport system substrate-binding protein [Moorella sp. (in: firmicutes)]
MDWRKHLAVLLVGVALAVSLASCGRDTSKQGQGNNGSSAKSITIGELAAMTGPTAAWGQAQDNEMQILVEKWNAGNPVKLTLKNYDFKGDTQEAVNAFNRLVDQDHVAVVFGTNNSNANLAFAPIAETKKVPVLSHAIDPHSTTPAPGKLNRYSFLTVASNIVQGKTMAAYALDKLHIKKVAILYDQGNSFATTMKEPFVEYFTSHGGIITDQEVFNTGDVEFRSQLSKIIQSQPDAILLPNYYKEIALAAQQARSLGFNGIFLGHVGWPSKVLLDMAARDVEGSYFVNYGSFDDPRLKNLEEEYIAKYNKAPEINAAMINESFAVFKDAVQRIGADKLAAMPVNEQRQALRDAFETAKNVHGVMTTITIDPSTHRPETLEMAIMTIKDGKFKFVETYSVPK